MTLLLPTEPETPNIRALAALTREEFTGLVTAVVTLTHELRAGTEVVVKNGSVVRPTTYTLSGKTITLGGALIAGDWVVVLYHARQGTA